MPLILATPEEKEARQPIEKWLGMYERGIITQCDLVHRLAQYALSFKSKEKTDAS